MTATRPAMTATRPAMTAARPAMTATRPAMTAARPVMTATRQVIGQLSAILCIVFLGTALTVPLPVHAEHIQPHQCGVKSASFARICRPNAYVTCLRASTRGVKGYSAPFCARRQTACRACVDKLRLCIAKIGHAKKSEFSCDECSGKFSRCIGKRYPKLKD